MRCRSLELLSRLCLGAAGAMRLPGAAACGLRDRGAPSLVHTAEKKGRPPAGEGGRPRKPRTEPAGSQGQGPAGRASPAKSMAPELGREFLRLRIQTEKPAGCRERRGTRQAFPGARGVTAPATPPHSCLREGLWHPYGHCLVLFRGLDAPSSRWPARSCRCFLPPWGTGELLEDESSLPTSEPHSEHLLSDGWVSWCTQPGPTTTTPRTSP